MKRALFWFLLLAALPPAYAVPSLAEPTCSTNCVSIEQKGHFAVVTGYNPEGVEVYMESVLIDKSIHRMLSVTCVHLCCISDTSSR